MVGDDAPYRLPAPRIATKAPYAGHEAFLHLPTWWFPTHEPVMWLDPCGTHQFSYHLLWKLGRATWTYQIRQITGSDSGHPKPHILIGDEPDPLISGRSPPPPSRWRHQKREQNCPLFSCIDVSSQNPLLDSISETWIGMVSVLLRRLSFSFIIVFFLSIWIRCNRTSKHWLFFLFWTGKVLTFPVSDTSIASDL